ncbi:MAG: Hpt domain-containing protein [Myxococcales bacterium]|nr:Hpt domain-containing protein [Myxococcales bacterium]
MWARRWVAPTSPASAGDAAAAIHAAPEPALLQTPIEPVSPTGPSRPPAWDRDEALALCGGDSELLISCTDGIPEEVSLLVAAIKAALAEGDGARVAAAAHRLKGSLLLVAAARSAELARALEVAGFAGDLERIHQTLGPFERELAVLTRELREFQRGTS